MKKVTIQDIADALGVSRNTVSKAINNSEGLAEATRERILQKAVEMGYKQFSYISSVSQTGASAGLSATPEDWMGGEIALFTGSPIDPSHFASLMLDRLKRELAQMNFTLISHRVERENLLCRTLPVTFNPQQARAIVCIEMFDRAYDEMVCSLGLPVLFVDGPNKRSGVDLPADQLYMDNTTGITRFVNDMLVRGKRKIGFIGDYEHCQSFFERYTAFRLAMMMAGEPVDERFVIKSISYENMGEQLTALSELPDVFICANDFVASDAIYIMRKLGLSVPKDVLFCGFDDSHESRIMTPTLTTVHIHTQIMAFSATQLLVSRIKEPELDYRTVHTETELIYRDSTRM